MATIVRFAESETPQRVLGVRRLVDPAPFRVRTDVLISPDLSAVEGVVDEDFWKHVAGAIVSMTAQEITDFDTARSDAAARAVQDDIDATRADAAGGLEGFGRSELILRAILEIILKEINNLRTEHSLTPRTTGQLKDAIKAKVESGDVD